MYVVNWEEVEDNVGSGPLCLCPSCCLLRHAAWYKRLNAWLLAKGSQFYARIVNERKHRLFGALSGTVLEIGPGSGANLSYYPSGIRWIGIEPNPYAHAYLQREAARRGLTVEICTALAERLPVIDGAADAVVGTLVLCTVQDPAAALAEVRRVLKPGGRFVFIEHVAAPEGSLLRRVQCAVRPFWQVLGDGCHPDRPTGEAIEAAGFARVELEYFRVPVPVVAPHIAGTAIR
jgi:SAM-dependent methyltransferase